MPNEWFVDTGNQVHGPLSDQQLKQLANGGQVTPASRIRLGINGNWTLASSVRGLFPPAMPPAVAADDLGFDALLNSVASKPEQFHAPTPPHTKPEPVKTMTKPRDLPFKDFSKLSTEKNILWNISFICTFLGIISLPATVAGFLIGMNGSQGNPAIAPYADQLISACASLFGLGISLIYMGVVLRIVCGLVDLGLYCSSLLEDIREQVRQ